MWPGLRMCPQAVLNLQKPAAEQKLSFPRGFSLEPAPGEAAIPTGTLGRLHAAGQAVLLPTPHPPPWTDASPAFHRGQFAGVVLVHFSPCPFSILKSIPTLEDFPNFLGNRALCLKGH